MREVARWEKLKCVRKWTVRGTMTQHWFVVTRNVILAKSERIGINFEPPHRLTANKINRTKTRPKLEDLNSGRPVYAYGVVRIISCQLYLLLQGTHNFYFSIHWHQWEHASVRALDIYVTFMSVSLALTPEGETWEASRRTRQTNTRLTEKTSSTGTTPVQISPKK